MSNSNLADTHCPLEVMRRIEKNVMYSCTHPAVRNPWRFSIDPQRQLLLLFIVVFTGFLIWQNRLFTFGTATAPSIYHPAVSDQAAPFASSAPDNISQH